MSKPLRILIIEDSEDDALLLVRELGRAGYDVASRRVETAEDMKAALAEGGWDAVVSDYIIPRFSGLAALEVLKMSGLDLPFIIVSGNIGEDIAVGAMRAGAHDYLIKGNLKRLASAMERELRESEIRRERGRAEADISRLNRLYLVLSKVNEAIVRIHDPQTLYEQVCRIAVEDGGFKMAWIGIVDEGSLRVRPAASHGDGGGYLDGLTIVAADVPEGKGPTGRAIVKDRHFICGDIEQDPIMRPWRDKALGHGFRSSAAFPLHSGAKAIGALTAYANTPWFFTGEEISLLSSLAGDISFALETMANEERRKEAERRTRVTNELLALFTQKFDQKSYLDAAAEVVRSWSGCAHIGMRIADDRGRIPYASCTGFSDEFLASEGALSLERDACACTRVVLGAPEPQDLPAMTRAGSFCCNQTEKFVEGLTDAQKARFRGVCIRSGFRSVAVIPIRHREKVLGAIHLADRREGMVPLGKVEFLEQMAHVVGEALFRFGVEQESFRLAAAVESAADAVAITEPARGVIQYVNSAFERVTGYSREEAVGKDLHLLDSGRHDEAFFRELRETLRREGVWSGRLVNKKKDGTHYFEDCTYSPVKSQSGEIINYVAVKRDVTEKIRLESIAESVSTMNSIGYVFSGVRHEIGNPINTVKMLLSVLQMKLEAATKETVAEYLSRAMNEIGRVEHLLRSLKNFNLFETPELEIVDTAAFLDRFLGLITEDFGKKGILLTREIGAGAERMRVDPRALQQVLLNIVANAADALEGRPSPRIDFLVTKKGARVLFAVSDNGRGITDQQRQNLFKPFHTSKPKGTGLGLVIVKKMLALMNSDIEITSVPDQGTTVAISLPEGTDAPAR